MKHLAFMHFLKKCYHPTLCIGLSSNMLQKPLLEQTTVVGVQPAVCVIQVTPASTLGVVIQTLILNALLLRSDLAKRLQPIYHSGWVVSILPSVWPDLNRNSV